jgi:hypothetical protein
MTAVSKDVSVLEAFAMTWTWTPMRLLNARQHEAM